jgi:hypothetical protein
MRYEVIQSATGSRFELDRDESLKEGELFTQLTMMYKVPAHPARKRRLRCRY